LVRADGKGPLSLPVGQHDRPGQDREALIEQVETL